MIYCVFLGPYATIGDTGLRAPFSAERLSRRPDGKIVYRMRRPWPNEQWATHLLLEPLDFLRRLAALVSFPYSHQVRYHGAYANRKRNAIQNAGKEAEDPAASGAAACGPPAGLPEGEEAYRRPQPSWARLLHGIFEIDPLLCPKCGSGMKVVSVITEPEVVDKILKSITRTGGRDPFERRGPPAEAAGPVEKIA